MERDSPKYKTYALKPTAHFYKLIHLLAVMTINRNTTLRFNMVTYDFVESHKIGRLSLTHPS